MDDAAPIDLNLDEYPSGLRVRKGCFVTLFLVGELRGCVGCLRARGPLVQEVARAAYSAAFRDPRFSPLEREDVSRVRIHVSILSDPVELRVESEDALMALLRPGIDGVILSEGSRLGTFLPDVWEKFPEPEEFLRQLRVKAGLPPSYWSETLKVERYTTEAFG
jgi:AmmeMemoRadiSam system protein A